MTESIILGFNKCLSGCLKLLVCYIIAVKNSHFYVVSFHSLLGYQLVFLWKLQGLSICLGFWYFLIVCLEEYYFLSFSLAIDGSNDAFYFKLLKISFTYYFCNYFLSYICLLYKFRAMDFEFIFLFSLECRYFYMMLLILYLFVDSFRNNHLCCFSCF